MIMIYLPQKHESELVKADTILSFMLQIKVYLLFQNSPSQKLYDEA